ncbi:hypothetical protein EDB83DRAFT_2324418 [Lactarius deliciosus]|nr:hypothetical protein EDB83DRAFT_2324418 [Lactarius deliciosus]
MKWGGDRKQLDLDDSETELKSRLVTGDDREVEKIEDWREGIKPLNSASLGQPDERARKRVHHGSKVKPNVYEAIVTRADSVETEEGRGKRRSKAREGGSGKSEVTRTKDSGSARKTVARSRTRREERRAESRVVKEGGDSENARRR